MAEGAVQILVKEGLQRAMSMRHEMQLEASGNGTARYRCQLCQLEFHVDHPIQSEPAAAQNGLELSGAGLTTRCQGYPATHSLDAGG